MLGYGDSFHISCLIQSDFEIAFCNALFGTRIDEKYKTFSMTKNPSTGRYEATVQLTPDMVESYYKLYQLDIRDRKSNTETYDQNDPGWNKNGYSFVFCDGCSKGNHLWKDPSEVTKEATCTEDGFEAIYCRVCNFIKPGSEIITPALGHDFNISYIFRATVERDGSIYFNCSRCKTSKSESIPHVKTAIPVKESYVYDGKKHRPTFTVKDAKNNIIPKSAYTISYDSDEKSVGDHLIWLKFKGNYFGNYVVSYTIAPKGTSISSVSKASKAFTVKWKKQTSQTTGYQLQYSTNKKFSGAKKVMIRNNKSTSKTIKKLKANKKYYVRIRTYKLVGGSERYSSWSKAKTVVTKK